MIQELKAQGRQQDIEAVLKKIASAKVGKNLAYVEGGLFEDCIHDMGLVQKYAEWNRRPS